MYSVQHSSKIDQKEKNKEGYSHIDLPLSLASRGAASTKRGSQHFDTRDGREKQSNKRPSAADFANTGVIMCAKHIYIYKFNIIFHL